MNNVIPFDFQSRQVRVVQIQSEPWFVANDVCQALDLTNPRKAVSDLDDDEKGVTTSDTLGGKQILNIINESGLYSLIFKSRKAAAKKFKRWVTHEVLPAIRKTGGYQQPKVPQSFSDALRLAADLEDRNRQLEHERDTAVSTKALIGSNREATAMARASTETRRANQLQKQLGVAAKWKSVKAIPWLSEEFVLDRVMYQQVGKKLRAISEGLGLQVNRVEDSTYGTIKSYHIDAINELWRRMQEDGELLAKYRKGRAA